MIARISKSFAAAVKRGHRSIASSRSASTRLQVLCASRQGPSPSAYWMASICSVRAVVYAAVKGRAPWTTVTPTASQPGVAASTAWTTSPR